MAIGVVALLMLVYIQMDARYFGVGRHHGRMEERHEPNDKYKDGNIPLSGNTGTFVKGESYSLDLRTVDLAGIRHTYCYETQYQWVFTDEMGQDDPCMGIEGRYKSLVSKINMEVRLKASTTQQMFNNLNTEYGVTLRPNPDGDDILPLEIPYQVGYAYNSYTLAQKYFDTGYFEFVRPTMTIGMGEEY